MYKLIIHANSFALTTEFVYKQAINVSGKFGEALSTIEYWTQVNLTPPTSNYGKNTYFSWTLRHHKHYSQVIHYNPSLHFGYFIFPQILGRILGPSSVVAGNVI